MQERGITQVGLADEFQVSQAAVSKWLKGKVPSGVTLVRLAHFFGVTAERLVGLEPEAANTGKSSKSRRVDAKNSDQDQIGSKQEAELSALLDQLKARIRSDLAICQPNQAQAHLQMLAKLFGAEHRTRQ